MLNRLLFCFVRLLSLSYRYRLQTATPGGERGRILATWHQNLLAGVFSQTGRCHTVMISRSRDAEPLAYSCSRLGHNVVRGSSRKGDIDKGGRDAKMQMIEALRNGFPGAITVDGPRGPAFQVKPGVIDMARQTGVDIYPYLAVGRRSYSFNSWDRFRLPLPFTTIDIYYGPALRVAADASDEQLQQAQARLKQELDLLEALQRQRRCQIKGRLCRHPSRIAEGGSR